MILLLLQNMYYQRVMDKYLQLKCISMIFQYKDRMILANLTIIVDWKGYLQV